MQYEIIGVDLSNSPDKTVSAVREIEDKIYQVFGLTRKLVDTQENNNLLLQFKKINNID